MSSRLKIHILTLLMAASGVLPGVSIAQDSGLGQKIFFETNEYVLQDFLKTISQQTSFYFSFDPQKISSYTRIKLHTNTRESSLEDLLRLLNESYSIQHVVKGKVIILQKSTKKYQASATISGVILDATSGETLPGANIYIPRLTIGTTSNHYGFFSLTRPQNSHDTLVIQFLGYKPVIQAFHFRKDSVVNILLTAENEILQNITIQGEQTNDPQSIKHSSGVFTISSDKIKATSSFAGEPDALKTLQLLPGVQSGNEGTTNISVRGGSFDQNLFLLDEAPVYNPSHALSFFSIFNPDAIQSLSLYKSSIPVSHGGRLSSVVDVRMKEGNRHQRKYSGAIGTIASRLTFEGPLSKKTDKASFIISGRYSYAGHVVNGVYLLGQYIFSDPSANNSTTDNKIRFYDINAKLNYRKSQKDHFYLSVYTGHDNFYFNHITSGYSLNWGNKTTTFRWNHVYTSKLFLNTTALFSDYNYEYRILNNTQYFRWNASFKEFDIKQDYDFYPTSNHHVVFGWGAQQHWISPGKIAPRNSTAVAKHFGLPKQKPINANAYIGNNHTVSQTLSLSYGLRYSAFILFGPNTRYIFNNNEELPQDSIKYGSGEIETVYHRIEPRATLTYQRDNSSFSISYDRTNQYFHLLANSSVGLPTDVWMPSGGSIDPQFANIYTLTYSFKPNKTFDGSISIYYKDLINIVDFKDNANLFVNRYVESQLLQGSGRSYGSEVFFQKNTEKFTGSISYTWSKTTNTIQGVNKGKSFPTRYDKRHNLVLSGSFTVSKRFEISSNFVYTSGGALTVPAGSFIFDGVSFNHYTNRNAYRLPDYHRLDLSLRYKSKNYDSLKYKSFWSFDLYNVYHRKNPFTVYSQQQDHNFIVANVKAFYLFGIVPTISYNFSF